jgi:hypothetical protein
LETVEIRFYREKTGFLSARNLVAGVCVRVSGGEMIARLWGIGLLLVAVALVAAGCGGATATPTASLTAVVVQTPAAGPTVDRVGARDAALAYVGDRYGVDAPAADLAWTEQYARPAEMVGGEVYQYTAGDWLITISYPVVLPELTVYTVKMANTATGFVWEGQVSAGGQVIEGKQLLLNAFNVALARIQAKYGDEAPPVGLAWVGERITPADLVGAETWRYTAGDWVATITYPVVPPDQMVFNITIQNPAAGFMWLGSVDTNGRVTEVE